MMQEIIDNCGCGSVKRVLFSEEEIKSAVEAAGSRISEEYKGKPLLMVSILKGSFVFLADLCRAVKIPCEIGFMAASSYESGTVSSGDVKITLDLAKDLSKYHVLIAEDIVDTGRTLSKLCGILREREPLSLKVCALLDKPSRRVTDFKADYTLFTVPDLFVVGYGLDCGGKFRNLPYIAELQP